ncbi:MAG: hypothetical protein P0Y53_05230 [Candidatus Pseudobacter hemicellulosilyticus]|uniref:Tetratricopeptide repeat protein n=1 Tax=Candidatus Pseudobacter hemicellulosilyticus TaxID=3121375 RepID=A0AAJ5WVH0_9BACT|nr:MAG: hypothetical protein P0Y53_05230 [Pseudobacter sp.]
MKPLITLLAFLTLFSPAFSQQPAPAASQLDIYSNETEARLLKRVAADSTVDLFELMLASDNFSGGALTLEVCRQKPDVFLAQNSLNGQATAKEIKKLFKKIHDAFLVKYEDNPAFSQLFSNGIYNCATATALYALLLDRMGIPYAIHEAPTHVYMVVAPYTHRVIFETTAPGMMIMQANDKMKTEYLEYLLKNKLITREEMQQNKDEVFNKYFYPDKEIRLRQLAGIIYHNAAVTAAQKEDHITAYKNFEKAYILYPEEKYRYLASGFLAIQINNVMKADQDKRLQLYQRYAEIGDKEQGNKSMLAFLDEERETMLFKSPDLLKYQQLYAAARLLVRDSATAVELRHDHYKDMARYYYLMKFPDTCLLYLDSAYALYPNDLLTKENYTVALLDMLQTIDSMPKIIDTIRYFSARLPFIEKNRNVQEYNIESLARHTYALLAYKEDYKDGLKYYKQLEAVLRKWPEFARKHQDRLVELTGKLAGYYVRQEKYKEAQQFLRTALEVFPGDEDILYRLQHVDKMVSKGK